MPRNIVFTATAGTTLVRWGNTPAAPDPASAFTLALSASSGNTGSPVTVTVTPTGGALSAAGTVTLVCTTATLAATSLSFASGATEAQTTTLTPSADGAHVVTMTNSLSLLNTGSPRSYTSTTSAGLTVGAQIATLSVVSESGSGARPYAATVLPLRGEVPSGSHVTNAAGTEAGAILSTHDDGSAAVVVFASTASATGSVALHVATGTAPVALTAAAIAAQVSSVAVAFGSPYGTASITDFSTPERVWWATSKVYCARYRVAAPTPGSTALEAVIDIHAYADRALVEVVVENAKMTTATPTKPTAASYTGATVSINGGAAIATVNAADMPTEAAHSAFRGWYAPGWVGAGSPGLRVTQLHTELQLHPLLFKCDQAASFDMAGYASDVYTPWSTGRQRATVMGAGGDHASIGPLPQWEARALQSGDYRAWKATEASALACLGYNINYRDSGTGLPPTFTQLKVNNVSQNGYSAGAPQHWPSQSNGSDAMMWDTPHHPAGGLMAFIARPSPVFIELAQKIAVWNGTWSTAYGPTPGTPTVGIFGAPYNIRGRAWGLRSLAHATFLTPDALAWKAAGKTSISANVSYLDGWRTDSKALLNAMWDDGPTDPVDGYGTVGGFGQALWMYHYLITELHKTASANLLTGSSQTAIDTLADWCALQPVRWVNEQANGGWRYVPYVTVMGRDETTIDSLSDWGAQMDYWMADAPPSVSGTWMAHDGTDLYSDGTTAGNGGANYASYFWSALVAAADRGVAGAATAWNAVLDGITNLATWRGGFASDPRWGSTPLNPPGFALGADVGSVVGDVWTPGKTAGVVNAASWATVPTAQWVRIAGTEMSTLTADIVAASLNWNSITLNWAGYTQSWAGWAPDQAGARLWFFAGGHSDGNNNGLYRFDCYKMSWAVECMPTDRLVQNSEYQPPASEGTTNKAANDAAMAAATASTLGWINDLYRDQFIADNKPTARHTYAGLTYDGVNQAIYITNGRFWRYSLTAGAWNYRRIHNDHPHTVIGGFYGIDPYMDFEHMAAAYDEVTNEVLMSSSGSGGINRSIGYALAGSGSWVTWTAPWRIYGNIIEARHGRTWTVFSPPTREVSGSFAGLYWQYNLDTRALTSSGTIQYGGGLVKADMGANTNDGDAMTWVPAWGKYLCCIRNAAGIHAFYTLDPTTSPWTLAPVAMTNAPTTISALLNRRMVHFDELGAILLQDLGSTNFYLYKL